MVRQGRPLETLDAFTDMTAFEKKEYLKLLQEAANRRVEALKLYRPLPFQQRFHECANKECIIVKGNRAGGAQPLYGQVLTPDGFVPMGSLSVGSTVISGDGLPCTVTHIHERGWMAVYRVTFDDRATAVCTGDHLWKCKIKKHEKFPSHDYYKPDAFTVLPLDDIIEFDGFTPRPSKRPIIPCSPVHFVGGNLPMDPYTLGVILGDGSISCDSVSFTTEDREIAENVEELCTIGKVTYRKEVEGSKARAYGLVAHHNCTTGKPSPVKTALKELGLMGTRSVEKFIPEEYMRSSIADRLQLLRGLMDTDGTADKKGHCYFYTNSPMLANNVVELVRSLGGKSYIRWKETSIRQTRLDFRKRRKLCDKPLPRKKVMNMAVVRVDLTIASPFMLERKTRRWQGRKRLSPYFGRYIETIEPAGNAICRCITVDSPDGTYIMENYIVTHNSIAGFAEDARAATAQDPFKKYPERDGVVLCLGYGEKHVGRVIHKLLFRAGSFRIIRDRATGEWRVYRAWPKDEIVLGHPGDEDREAEAKPAPPMIPPRMIDGFSWEKKSEHVFSIARLTTGWEIHACNSAGDPSQAQGFDVNLYHIDEDTATPGWYEEAIGRTAIPKGLIRWTALPHARNDDIMGMIARAEDEEQQGIPEKERTTICLRASVFDNPFYPAKSREANIKIWAAQGEDVLRKRIYGEVVQDTILMYPEFNKYVHCAQSDKENASSIQALLAESHGAPPDDWCIDMIVDPGHTVCAVLFVATPPPMMGDYKVCFDELYLRLCDAKMFGEAVERKAAQMYIQRFIIDMHGGMLREIGSGQTPVERYTDELKMRGISCVETGAYFIPGSDKIKSREEALREWLRVRRDGTPTLYVDHLRCPNTVRELSTFKKRRVRMGLQWIVSDDGDRRANTHTVECLEYAAAHGLQYVIPRAKPKAMSYAKRAIMARQARAAQRAARTSGQSKSYITLGPTGES